MIWNEKRSQPRGDSAAVPDRMWAVLTQRLGPVGTKARDEFEADRARCKALLEKKLDELDAMLGASGLPGSPEYQAWWERRWEIENWCQAQEVGHFLKWADRTKWDWRSWQAKRAAFVEGRGEAP